MSEESRKVTKECFERDFLNAKTPYDQWKVFKSVLSWATTSSALAEDLSRKNEN